MFLGTYSIIVNSGDHSLLLLSPQPGLLRTVECLSTIRSGRVVRRNSLVSYDKASLFCFRA